MRPAVHLPEFLSRDTEPIDPDFRDIPDFSELGDAGEIHETVYPVRFHDLDANGHVNNAVYFEWVFEATPINLMARAGPRQRRRRGAPAAAPGGCRRRRWSPGRPPSAPKGRP